MKIFLPTDFSKQSAYAEQLAVAYAGVTNGHIHLFHSIKSPVDWRKVNPKEESKYPEVKAKVAKAKVEMDAFAKRHPSVKVTWDLGFNAAHESIPELAKKEKCDLIVMGGHGESGFDEEHLGSNTRKVLRSAKSPLLLVRKKPGKELPKRIVITSDFGEKTVKILKQATELLAPLNPELHLLFVNSPLHFKNSDETDTMMQKASKMLGIPNSKCHIFNYQFVEDGIQRFCNLHKADAVVFISQTKQGMFNAFSYSYTENTAELLDVPVLVLKA
jgi:nucleotide-binding universal stress UspA family protein